jgi:Tfp pilus assembly protein PilO
MNDSIWRKYDIFVNIAVFVSVVALIIYFVALPMKQRVADSSDELKKKKIDNEVATGRIARIPEMEKVHGVILKNKDDLDVIFNKNNEVKFIEKLEGLASETGNEISLKMEYVSPADEKKKNATKSVANKDANKEEKIEILEADYLSVQIELTGKYEQMLNFLNKIENMEYVANVVALDLKKEAMEEKSQDAHVAGDMFSVGGTVPAKELTIKKDELKSRISMIVYLNN